MNKWEQQRAVLDELLRMEEAGEVRQNPETGQWETTEFGLQVAFQQMKEDFGMLAPIVRLLDRMRAYNRRRGKFSNVINEGILPKGYRLEGRVA